MLFFKKKKVSFDAKRCMTCGVCVSVCPVGALEARYVVGKEHSIKFDEAMCISCGKCISICPASKMMERSVLDELNFATAKAYLAWHKNEELRAFASSGGVARGLIVKMLQSNMVDAAYSLYDDLSNNFDLEGKWLEGEVDYHRIPSSIYRPVLWGGNIAAVHPEWKSVLVVGLPCQIKGAKALFDKYHPRLQVFSIVIFCKKQKAQSMTRTYLRHFKAGLSRLKDFRYRGEGYPGRFRVQGQEQPSAPFIYPAKAWYPYACRFCLDPLLAGEADIVLADPWQLIDREKETLGKNLMIVQSKQAMEALSKIDILGCEKIEDINQAYFTSLTMESYREKAAQAERLANHTFDLNYLKERVLARCGEYVFGLFGADSFPARLLLKTRMKRN